METSPIEGLEEVLVYKTNLDIGSVVARREQILGLKRKTELLDGSFHSGVMEMAQNNKFKYSRDFVRI